MKMKLKTSFLSGEFWLFAGIALGMMYLEAKGISAADIRAHGEVFVVKAQDYVTSIGPLLLAVAFGVKRTILKVQKMKAEMTIQIEQIRAALRGGAGGDPGAAR